MEETDSISSDDEEMMAQEEQQLNEILADLGVPPLVVDATPISMAFESHPAPGNAPSETILIPSDTEEGNTELPTAPEHTILPETVTSDSAARSPTEEIDPHSALVVYSRLVIP